MKLSGRALRLSSFIGEGDFWHHKPLYAEIVHRAHKAGLAGATVIRGIEGYGASSRIHTQHPFRISSDLPLLIAIIDAEDRVRAFLPQLDVLEINGLVTLDNVEVIRYVASEQRPRRSRRPDSEPGGEPGEPAHAGTPAGRCGRRTKVHLVAFRAGQVAVSLRVANTFLRSSSSVGAWASHMLSGEITSHA